MFGRTLGGGQSCRVSVNEVTKMQSVGEQQSGLGDSGLGESAKTSWSDFWLGVMVLAGWCGAGAMMLRLFL
jgi:hypothetical protein